MKKIILTFTLFVTSICLSQSNFQFDEYIQFLQSNKNMESADLMTNYPLPYPYYKGIKDGSSIDESLYMDSVQIKYNLTDAELDILKANRFVVSERLSFENFGMALRDVHLKDLPVFITSDIILHALHASYEKLLWDIELKILKPKLKEFLDLLYASFSDLVSMYGTNQKMQYALEDADLYITIAKSLLEEKQLAPQYTSTADVNTIWEAIQAEQYAEMPLFCERNRKLDFSQFTPRGHYTDVLETSFEEIYPLKSYFKCMMWLGRMDFLLTAPPENPFESPWEREEIRRMNLGAALIKELMDITSSQSTLTEIDNIIIFMVGESDNLTPAEHSTILISQGITKADELLNDATYDAFQEALTSSSEYGQKILSSIFTADPYSSEPATLPISYRIMGQRFLIDSYIAGNVVYDNIVYNDQKIWRPMPDPMDVLFVLGNENTLPLLETELDEYKYSSQLNALRYLVDAYDHEFWNGSLYNVWLNTIRQLNPSEDRTGFPFFMKTAAWQQEKINTQLASWTQLRHDNVLYAKQSYTTGGGCTFPHSYIEPYPKLYKQIGAFADKAGTYFSQVTSDTCINYYFPRLKNIMTKLETLAQKELERIPFNNKEKEFLQQMLFSRDEYGGPVFTGWFTDLFYNSRSTRETNYLTVDIHTQPTDENGNTVGRVLHVGTGKINLGIFLTDSPSGDYQSTAFVGPVMSYYEKITNNFDRLTDERWEEFVGKNTLPIRPDWVNIYLTDGSGNTFDKGRELPVEVYTSVKENNNILPDNFMLSQNYPNPFNPSTVIKYQIPNNKSQINPNSQSSNRVMLRVYDLLGREVVTLVNQKQNPGYYEVNFDASHLTSGVYFYNIQAGDFIETKKMILLR